MTITPQQLNKVSQEATTEARALYQHFLSHNRNLDDVDKLEITGFTRQDSGVQIVLVDDLGYYSGNKSGITRDHSFDLMVRISKKEAPENPTVLDLQDNVAIYASEFPLSFENEVPFVLKMARWIALQALQSAGLDMVKELLGDLRPLRSGEFIIINLGDKKYLLSEGEGIHELSYDGIQREREAKLAEVIEQLQQRTSLQQAQRKAFTDFLS